jgi:hypothetical protein
MKKLTVPRVLMVLLKVPVLKIQIHTMKICQLWKGQRDPPELGIEKENIQPKVTQVILMMKLGTKTCSEFVRK